MEKLGYDWDQIHARFPKIIFASVSGYGQTGPESRKPGYDMVLQGVTGMMSITGEADGEPCRTGISIADVGTGLFTAVAISSALLHRERTGESTRIDLAMFDCMLSIMETPISRYLMTGEIATRMGSFLPAIMPFEAFATQDSHITLACGNDKIFKQFCAAIHREDLAKNPDFASNLSRVENRNALRTEIGKELAGATTAQWTSRLEMLGIPVGPINNVAQAVDHPQVAARNMLVETLDPLLGPLRVVGSPFKMSAFSDSTTRKLAPELDEDRDRLIAEFHRAST
jgi:CoA:oxalate CoA-transferase